MSQIVQHFGSGTYASCIVVSRVCPLELVFSRFSQGKFHLTRPHKLDGKRHELDVKRHTHDGKRCTEAYKQCKRDINASDSRYTTGGKRHITGEERHTNTEVCWKTNAQAQNLSPHLHLFHCCKWRSPWGLDAGAPSGVACVGHERCLHAESGARRRRAAAPEVPDGILRELTFHRARAERSDALARPTPSRGGPSSTKRAIAAR